MDPTREPGKDDWLAYFILLLPRTLLPQFPALYHMRACHDAADTAATATPEAAYKRNKKQAQNQGKLRILMPYDANGPKLASVKGAPALQQGPHQHSHALG